MLYEMDSFPYFVLCGPDQGDGAVLPAFGRFARIESIGNERGSYGLGWHIPATKFRGLLFPPIGSKCNALSHLDSPVWAVVRLDRGDACAWGTEDGILHAAVWFSTGFVLFRGSRQTALSILNACESGKPLNTPLSALQDSSGVAYADDYGIATAGDEGFARAGFCGVAEAGIREPFADPLLYEYSSFGVALAGVRGTASSGTAGLAVVGSGGTARAGDYGVAIARFGGEFCSVEAGREGVAICGASEGIVIAAEKAVAVAGKEVRWLAVGRGGVGVGRGHVKGVDVADEALVVVAGLSHGAMIRLGRDATLICEYSGILHVFTTRGGERESGVYSFSADQLHRRRDDIFGLPDVSWPASREEAPYRAPHPPAPAFHSDVPWWEAARDHDPDAEIRPEPIREGQIVVLCASIPPAELAAGRKDGEWWLGAVWGQGKLPLTDGAPCCLVRVEGEHEPGQHDGDPIRFRQGTALYRGTLRGAFAALCAVGAGNVLEGRIALAGHGGVARVPSREEPVPLPLPDPDETERYDYGNHYYVLRGDRKMPFDPPPLAVAGDEGFAICEGEAHAGERGVACVTGLGVARAGKRGIALCENGRALAGESGIAISRQASGRFTAPGGQAVSGWRGIAVATLDGAAAITADSGIAVTKGGRLARVGAEGVAIGAGSKPVDVQGGAKAVVVAREGRVTGGDRALLVAWDAGTQRWIAAVAGRGDIEPGVAYVARNGRFEPSTGTVVTEVRRKR